MPICCYLLCSHCIPVKPGEQRQNPVTLSHIPLFLQLHSFSQSGPQNPCKQTKAIARNYYSYFTIKNKQEGIYKRTLLAVRPVCTRWTLASSSNVMASCPSTATAAFHTIQPIKSIWTGFFTEGSSPARTTYTSSTNMITGSIMLTRTILLTARTVSPL